jgi:hypothetical protein
MWALIKRRRRQSLVFILVAIWMKKDREKIPELLTAYCLLF